MSDRTARPEPPPHGTLIEIEGATYSVRRYTPKRRGQWAGWGWIRDRDGHRAEVGGGEKVLVDEVWRLRKRVAELEHALDHAVRNA